MPEYLAPGVYVEEVPSSIKPIVGVSTSTAAFVGIIRGPIQVPEDNPDYDPTKDTGATNQPYRTWTFPAPDGDLPAAQQAFTTLCKAGVKPPRPADASPAGLKAFRTAQANLALAAARSNAGALADAGTPILCTTFADFKRSFGDFSMDPDQNKLVHGVFGFFNNEGTRCYVMRYPDLTSLQAPTALAPFEAIDEISIVAAPGINDVVVWGNLIDHCENMNDRVAILDPPDLTPPADFTEDSIKKMSNTDYGALYFPRIEVFDIVTKLTDPDSAEGEIFVAPSGHMAGIWARVDNTRGVFKAPANEPIHGALGVEYQISKSLQAGLNPYGINAIRNINGKINVWGARTIGGDLNADTKYINVRRTLIFIRKSIDEGTQWVVFEPNDQSLWQKIIRNVGAFLTNVWRDGALFGATPQEAFYVKCDEETNPPEVRDLGQVITEIGVAIVRPAEFVIFRIQQWAGPAAQ
jgi:phage tail sheath protein FI